MRRRRGKRTGNVAKENLSRLAFGKTATVEYKKRDRYGRIVDKVIINGKDVSLDMLRGARVVLQIF